MSTLILSIVTPAYYEAGNLPQLYERIQKLSRINALETRLGALEEKPRPA